MKRNRRIKEMLKFVPLTIIVCYVLFPYLWTFLTSIKPTDELYTMDVKILPKNLTFENYFTLFHNTDFFQSMLHSIVIAVITSCISMLVSSMAAYAFARYRFRGKNLALSGILLLYMFPSVLYLTPLFVLFNNLKLIGSPLALVVSYCTFTIPFSIWLLTAYMKSIPLELEEAGKIDGASIPKLLYYVVMPLLKPGLIATGTYLVGEYDLRWDIISAGAVAAMIPVVILFMFVQKSLVAGLTAGSVKG